MKNPVAYFGYKTFKLPRDFRVFTAEPVGLEELVGLTHWISLSLEYDTRGLKVVEWTIPRGTPTVVILAANEPPPGEDLTKKQYGEIRKAIYDGKAVQTIRRITGDFNLKVLIMEGPLGSSLHFDASAARKVRTFMYESEGLSAPTSSRNPFRI